MKGVTLMLPVKMLWVFVLVLSCYAAQLSDAQDDFLVCKQFTNMSSEDVAVIGGNLRLPHGPKGDKGDEGIAGKGEQGIRGSQGLRGAKGSPGKVNYHRIKRFIDRQERTFSSCYDIKWHNSSATNGLYLIKDVKGSTYWAYCDMTIDSGGWTLVASVHEDYLGGKCTIGDRWSSQHGNNAAHPNGDGAWENTAIFGAPESATSDDYKNPAYFNMFARDLMIWHVPNRTPMEEYEDRAFMMYHTDPGFLVVYGGNLYKMFNNFYPLRSGTYFPTSGNGPSVSVTWDRGNNTFMVRNTPPNARNETTPGYIQFRAINNERGAYAICPGVKVKPGFGDVEHYCVGGTSNQGDVRYCGDFSAFDWNGYATGIEWSSNREMTESVVMIFYR